MIVLLKAGLSEMLAASDRHHHHGGWSGGGLGSLLGGGAGLSLGSLLGAGLFGLAAAAGINALTATTTDVSLIPPGK